MRTVLLEGGGVVTVRGPNAGRIISTNSVMIVPLCGAAVSAIIQNSAYGNSADVGPWASLNKEVLIWSKLAPSVNLNVNGSC